MIKHNVIQGTDEWLKLRAGIPTASELDALITPLWKLRTGEGVDTYLCKKLAERWLQSPLIHLGSVSMEQGAIREKEAIPYYEFTRDVSIERVGFITIDDGSYGCSPDGMFEDGTGIEIKCPEPHTHCKYLNAGELPKDYAAQVHGSMAATGASSWKFMSYCRNFPEFVIDVKRDDVLCTSILKAVGDFNFALNEAYAKLVKRNGGEPDRSSFVTQQAALQI